MEGGEDIFDFLELRGGEVGGGDIRIFILEVDLEGVAFEVFYFTQRGFDDGIGVGFASDGGGDSAIFFAPLIGTECS